VGEVVRKLVGALRGLPRRKAKIVGMANLFKYRGERRVALNCAFLKNGTRGGSSSFGDNEKHVKEFEVYSEKHG
jgi:hypothetical protein